MASDGFGDIVNVYNGLVTSIYEELPGFNYYPNPTTGLVSFSGEGPGNPSSITIYNASGVAVKVVELEDRRMKPVDISGLNSGMYLFRIQTDDRYYTLKVLKQ